MTGVQLGVAEGGVADGPPSPDGQGDTSRLLAASSTSDLQKKSDPQDGAPPEKRISTWLVFVSMFKWLAGLGTLSVSKAAADLGVAGFVIVNIFFAAVATFGCHLFGRALDLVGREDMNVADFGKHLLGRTGYYLCFLIVFLDNWGVCAGYWVALASTIQDVLQDHRIADDNVPTLTSKWFLILILAVAVSPLVAYRRLAELNWVMVMGNASMAVFIIAVVVNAIAESNGGMSVLPTLSHDKEAVLACTIIAFSFDCQINIVFNYRELDAPIGRKARKLTKASAASIFGYVLVVCAVGFAGCAAYAHDDDSDGSTTLGMKDNLLNNLPFGFIAVKLLVVLSGIPCIPLMCFENVAMLQDLPCLSQLSPKTSNILGTAFMVVTTAVAAAVVPGLYILFAYIGATTAMSLVAVLPPLLYIAAVWRCYHAPADRAPDRDPSAVPLPAYPPLWERAAAVASLTFGVAAVPFSLWITIVQS